LRFAISSELPGVAGLAVTAMLNPSLVAATTAMLLLPNPESLMLGYLLGAYTTSITVSYLTALTRIAKVNPDTAADRAPGGRLLPRAAGPARCRCSATRSRRSGRNAP